MHLELPAYDNLTLPLGIEQEAILNHILALSTTEKPAVEVLNDIIGYCSDALYVYGLDYFIESYACTLEEEDWKTENDEMLALFAKNGYSTKDLEEA